MKFKEKVLKEVLKGGQCPDCSKKVDKCNCSFKELYVTLKIKKVGKAIDLTLAEVGKVIDGWQKKHYPSWTNPKSCTAKDYEKNWKELKQKLGIK